MASVLTHVDITNCDREPIHLLGAIQPHGILIALANTDLRIVQASENVASMFGIAAVDLLGRAIDDVLGAESVALIRAASRSSTIEAVNPIAMSVLTLHGERPFDAILHRSNGEIVLELEPLNTRELLSPHEFNRVVRTSIEGFAAVRTVKQLCDAAVEVVAQVSGFDRVMVYRFDDDWHGEVVAEQHASGMEPYLGLHYPASDIPRQARDMFKRNWLRFIPDVAYTPVAIVPSDTTAGEPLDLGCSVLRSV